MIISHEKKFIFIHVQKTAGTSIRNCIGDTLKEGSVKYKEVLTHIKATDI